jgi:hypothetical protein
MTTYLPKYFTKKALTLYIVLLIVCSLAATTRVLPFQWIVFGLIEVICFFYFSNILTQKWSGLSPTAFKKKLFRVSLIIRVLYVIFSYFFYIEMTGQPFEFAAADSLGYDGEAKWLLSLIKANRIDVYIAYVKGNISDMGYVAYLTSLYSIFGDGVIWARLIKALLSAYTCVLVYKIGSRNFNDATGKIAGVLVLLSPNLIYYCGLHLKETEMVFLTMLFLERADYLIRSKQISVRILIPVIILGLSLFFFRTVLGVAAFCALTLGFMFFADRGKINLGKKMAFAFVFLILGLVLQGGRVESEIDKYWGDRDTNQKQSMQARATKGNSLASYGSAAVFAPLVLIAPFPTLVNIETQQNQMLLNGGYFTRNIIVFFTVIALLLLWKQKTYKKHLLLLSFLFGYLAILAFSKFALSERFHLPILPIIFLFAALGITQLTKKNARYFIPYLTLISLIILAWNIFKVAGRDGL